MRKIISGPGFPAKSVPFSARKTILAAAVVLPAQVLAQSFPEGCWLRDYGPDHLAARPAQNVASLSIRFLTDDYGSRADVSATLADQGRAASEGLSGRTLDQSASCFDDGDHWLCAVDCDGGSFRIQPRNAVTLDIVTEYFLVGDTEAECGGPFDLAEAIGEPVTYRLHRQQEAACD